MILSEAVILLAAGLALGVFLLATAVRFVAGMLYGVYAFDPIRLTAITVVPAFVAAIAGLVPALRAASIDPIRALRVE